MTLLQKLILKPSKIVDQPYGEHPAMRYDEYPVSNNDSPIVIFWHGGSWKRGDKSTYRFVGYQMQRMGAHTFVIGYPKFPERTFPGFIDDAEAALNQIKDRYPNKKIFVMGHSAGANTALLVGINKHNNVRGVISFAAPNTLAARYWRPVFGDAIDNKSYDPRTLLSKIDSHTKFLLYHGLLDHVVKPTDSISLHRLMKKAGVENKLVLLRFAEHITILPSVIIGIRPFSKRKLQQFIFS